MTFKWKSPSIIKAILSLLTNRVAYGSLCKTFCLEKLIGKFMKSTLGKTRALPCFSVYKMKEKYFSRRMT